MKCHLTAAGGQLTFELSGETTKDLFEQISSVQEIFEAEKSCGCCQSEDLRFLARQVDDYRFYEVACQNPQCRARFAFGQAKKGGGLFPKRKDEDGNWLPNRGWSKFVAKGEAVGNGPTQTNGTARPAPPKQDGVHVFLDWDAAQSSPQWGAMWLQVGGVKYKLGSNGEYQKAA